MQRQKSLPLLSTLEVVSSCSLFYILWTVSNCKNKFNSSHRLWNAVVYLVIKKNSISTSASWMDRYLGQDEDFQFWKIHPLYTDKQCIPTYSSMPCCSNRSPAMNYFVHLKVMNLKKYISTTRRNVLPSQWWSLWSFHSKDEAQEVEMLPILWPLIKLVPKKMRLKSSIILYWSKLFNTV